MNQLLTGHSCLNSHKTKLDGMSAAKNEIIIIFIFSRRFRKAVNIFERWGRLLGQTTCGDHVVVTTPVVISTGLVSTNLRFPFCCSQSYRLRVVWP